MATPTKRARIQEPEKHTIASASELNARNCHLGKLPLELLADVLSYMPSTRDVLALARTSKQFCSILVNNPATVFIWRHARARCVLGAIPELLPGMGEATYAALLFDSGICEVRKTYHQCVGMFVLITVTGLRQEVASPLLLILVARAFVRRYGEFICLINLFVDDHCYKVALCRISLHWVVRSRSSLDSM